MNVFTPADRATVLAEAERMIVADGLRVLDRHWESGDHQLDLVASVCGALVVFDIRDVDLTLDSVFRIAEERARELRAAAGAWQDAHGTGFGLIRVDGFRLVPNGAGLLIGERFEAVA